LNRHEIVEWECLIFSLCLASADRRPVDPPPVVELRIFEGGAKNDITFSYNANFFLFATLELARPMIHGRVQPSAQQIPVLTGMPVSGMAYLDRPAEAGYFIFPDLSVRHEGKYRLSFNLYEETKEAKDGDAERPNDNQSKIPPPALTPNGSFDWRLEVKSAPFTVFSAKKFPGLAESTVLSRTVAEQGCRVRIRRDVRMRRRDGKPSGDFDEYDEEYSRARRTATPDSVHDAYIRQRSLSNASLDRQPYAPEGQRRPAGVEYTQQPYGTNYASPPITQPGSSGYLQFGATSTTQQYQAPQYHQPPSQPIPSQQQQYQPSQPTFQPPPAQYRQPPAPVNYNYSERQSYAAQYTPRDNYENDYRRSSVSYPSAPPASNQYSTASDQNANRLQPSPSYQQYPPPSHTPVIQPPVNLAPLKMPPLEPKYESLSSPLGPLSTGPRSAPPLPNPGYQDRQNNYSHYTAVAPAPSVPEPTRTGKRSFDSVFSTSYNQPLHNGMRPTSSHHNQSSGVSYDDDDTVSMEALRMQYKRADGTSYSRELPTLD
jgi:Velvet factor